MGEVPHHMEKAEMDVLRAVLLSYVPTIFSS